MDKRIEEKVTVEDLVEFFVKTTYCITDAKKKSDGHYDIKFNEGLATKFAEDFLSDIKCRRDRKRRKK